MQKYFYLAIFLAALSCCLCFSFIEARAADNSSSDGVNTALSQLENKYFEHQYNSDTDIDRLNRLEDFIYGTRQTGSVAGRVKHILSTILDEENDQTITTPQTSKHTNSNAPIANQQNDESLKNDSPPAVDNNQAQSLQSPQNKAFDYGSYPRVASLERELLGRTYPNDSLPDRLKRLETKAYGAPSSSNDLCQRVDLLDDYAQRHDLYGEHQSANNLTNNLANNRSSNLPLAPTTPIGNSVNPSQEPWMTSSSDVPQTYPSNEQPTYTSNSGTFVGSVEERVSMMEAQLFQHTYPDKPLEQRLKKLAKKILPDQDIVNLPPAEQTVRLWDALHPDEKNQVASLAANAGQSYDTTSNTTDNNQASTNSAKRGSWLHRLANAGSSFAGTSMTPNSSMPTTYGTNAPYYGLGIPGSGLPGYGNTNSRFIGASVGPGAGPAGLPVGFW